MPRRDSDVKPEIRPSVPSADRDSGQRIFLEHADMLHKLERDSFMILNGNVEFSKGAMRMFCDSAHYYPDAESMDAFGNVRMEQGDTLFVYADELNYSGPLEIAYLYADTGKKVRLINREVMLETDEFVYDLFNELGYYTVGGVLTDKSNRLTSMEGEYVPSTKEANFYRDVHLNSRSEKDTLDIYTDTLYYNTGTHIAELYSPSEIINARATIYTRNGNYNTDTHVAELYDRSKVKTNGGSTLEGDTLFYDREAGYGEAFGHMALTDSARQSKLTGDYGFYNELADSSYVTGHALAMEYSRGDTLYLHGRHIHSFTRIDTIAIPADTLRGTPADWRTDTTHIIVAHPRVRFFRNDMQGVCDSMRFEERDSMLYMFVHPIVWSDDRQIFGNLIQLHLNDSTVDRAMLPDFGFTAQHIEDIFFNQLSGKSMTAWFSGGEMTRLSVDGNVEAILLPEENDSTINKIVNAESSFLIADFKDQNIVRLKMWPETSGTVTPLYLARKSLFLLPRFKWYEGIRPTDPDDVFNIPPEMDELMNDNPASPDKRGQGLQNVTINPPTS